MNVDPSVRAHPSAGVRHVGSSRTRVMVRAARPQLAVMGAQLVAGAGNLLFAVVLARVLAPGEYASIVTFLALFVLLHVPSAALSAAGALAPERIEQLTARVAVRAWPPGRRSSPPADRSATPAVSIDHSSSPSASPPRQRCCSGSLAALPTATNGSPGSAPASSSNRRFASVPASSWRWRSVRSARRSPSSPRATPPWRCARRRRRRDAAPDVAAVPTRSVAAVGFAFVLLAVVQSADLLVANRVLAADEADRFAVLSTIGGAAFFATATIPLVLLPAVRRGRAQAAATAYALTAATGLGITVVASSSPVRSCGSGSVRGTATSRGSSAPTSWRWRCSAWSVSRWPAAPSTNRRGGRR